MREIKFRAWDRQLKCLTVLFTLWDVAEGMFPAKDFADFDFMQFTGLHDKNGKEIWEGDVVRFYRHRTIENIRWEVAAIRWKANGYVLGDDAVYFFGDEWREFEVIGNIYENPDLLANHTV